MRPAMRYPWALGGVLLGLLASTSALAADDMALQPSPPGCITASSSPAEKEAAAERVAADLLAPKPGMPSVPAAAPPTFGAEIGELAKDNVFGNLWPRCGLSRRDRSLVTLGILIALRAENELRYHIPIAIRNGLTRREIEEVIYQATGYAGFPAASSARLVAQEMLPPK